VKFVYKGMGNMRLVIQRVTHASVTVDDQIVGQCGVGLCILAGVKNGDTQAEAKWLAKRGRRPDFIDAARPEEAEPLIDYFVEQLRAEGVPVQTGVFRAMMQVEIHNDGPVTILLERERESASQQVSETDSLTC
jgi:D-tyrosyl-tRNA(Tyr) deacylase